MIRRFPIVLTMLATACGAASPAPVTDGGTSAGPAPTIEVGTGSDHFVALHDGDDVTLIHGPQGGYHIWGALRTTGLGTDVVVDYAVVLDETSEQLSSTSYKVSLQKQGDSYTWAGLIGYVPQPAQAIDHDVRLEMTATDSAGHSASGQHRVHVLAPAQP